jgi:hypothetical protein
MNKTVWVVNHRKQDLKEAEVYGNIKILTEEIQNSFAIDYHIKNFKIILKDSNATDYMLPCGSIPLNIVACGVMLELHKCINLLIFDMKRKKYLVRCYNQEDMKWYN